MTQDDINQRCRWILGSGRATIGDTEAIRDQALPNVRYSAMPYLIFPEPALEGWPSTLGMALIMRHINTGSLE